MFKYRVSKIVVTPLVQNFLVQIGEILLFEFSALRRLFDFCAELPSSTLATDAFTTFFVNFSTSSTVGVGHVALIVYVVAWFDHLTAIVTEPVFNAVTLEAHIAFLDHVRQIAGAVARALVFTCLLQQRRVL